MPKKKSQLKSIERDIIKLLDKSIAPLSANEVSGALGIAYVTADKYLKILTEKKIVEKAENE